MCDHNTTTVIYSGKETSVEVCDWGCDQILIYKIMPDGMTQLVREVENPRKAWYEAELHQLTAELLDARRAKAMAENFANELYQTARSIK